jgi:hypothetical protein
MFHKQFYCPDIPWLLTVAKLVMMEWLAQGTGRFGSNSEQHLFNHQLLPYPGLAEALLPSLDV